MKFNKIRDAHPRSKPCKVTKQIFKERQINPSTYTHTHTRLNTLYVLIKGGS